jgi:hypothetical protein
MAYDPTHGTVLLSGGGDGVTLYGDTWELANGTWTQRATTGPAVGGAGVLAYDPILDRMLLVGQGADTTTWLWDGSAWSASVVAPATFTNGAATTSDRRGRVVMVANNEETWTWTGADWVLEPSSGPYAPIPNVPAAALAVDAKRRRVLIVGGIVGYDAVRQAFMWDGVGKDVTSATLPSARYAAGLAHDDARDQFLLFGGSYYNNGIILLGDFYRSPDGVNWEALPTPPIGVRQQPVMVYDAAHGTTLVFGGYASGGRADDTWLWDGIGWTQQLTAAPPARDQACAAYDPIRQRIVMFGGNADSGDKLGDTWEWDGTTWTEIHPTSSPTPRSGCAMAWDAGLRKLVMQGGSGQSSASADTWTWNGATWSQLITAGSPGSVSGHQMFTSLDGNGVTVHEPGDIRGVLVQMRWQSDAAPEHCGPVDGDFDELAACADLDCWPYCTPLCPPGTSCTDEPVCGDSTCDVFEDCWTCAADCGACF